MTATISTEAATVPAPAADPATDRTDRPTRRERGRRFLWLLLAALVVGGALRVAIGLTDDAPSTDETAYLHSGISLVEGEGFTREGHPELHFPPFVPFVLGMTSRVFADPHTGTVWVTILTGTATLVPLALLARRIAGDTAGAAAAWIAALAPGLATLPVTRGAGSETTYTLLVVSAVWLTVTTVDRRGRAGLACAGGAGLLIGLAYLTRPEGLFIAVPLGAAVVLAGWRGTDGAGSRWLAGLRVGGAFVVALLACLVPYVRYLHEHTGEWQLTAKTQDVSMDAWRAVARGDREARDEVLYALDESGLHFADDRSTLPALAREDPSGYLSIAATNVRVLGKNVAGMSLLPLPLWVLAGVGAWRGRRSRRVQLLLVVSALPVATALMFFVQPRYLVVPTGLATVLAGAAVPSLASRRSIVMAAAIVLMAVPVVDEFHGTAAGWWHPNEHTDQRRAGEWIAAHTSPDEPIMTRSMVTEFYAERRTIAIPYAELDQILAFGRHYGAHYLVVDSSLTVRLRPQLEPLLTEDDIPGLRLVHELHAEGRTSRIFAFDPPPPLSDEIGPSLGFMGDG
jgi:hypothetical protein